MKKLALMIFIATLASTTLAAGPSSSQLEVCGLVQDFDSDLTKVTLLINGQPKVFEGLRASDDRPTYRLKTQSLLMPIQTAMQIGAQACLIFGTSWDKDQLNATRVKR
jgi:hypothetical protein